jgi:hypothetical protein
VLAPGIRQLAICGLVTDQCVESAGAMPATSATRDADRRLHHHSQTATTLLRAIRGRQRTAGQLPDELAAWRRAGGRRSAVLGERHVGAGLLAAVPRTALGSIGWPTTAW